jgi:para-nitrobenzyl esterase
MRPTLTAMLLCLSLTSHADQVILPQGPVSGDYNDGIFSFLGIRYAQPPTGERRWSAPLPVRPGDSPIEASAFSPACLQPERPYANTPAGYSEDCLTLNVWSPSLSGALPVMVWIHGGGFRFGSNVFPGEVFAERGVVLVSINYRLGPLGFFAHEALDSKVANFGLLDMELALRWLQEHIGRFGGDPDQVTVFGVSAGGQAVNLLMASPRTKGLFHRAISQSGYGTWALPRSKNAPVPAPRAMDGEPAVSAEAMSAEIVGRLGVVTTDASALRALDGEALVTALEGFQLPIVDGTSLPEEPGIRFLRGEQQPVPLMTGGNSYEGSVMPAAAITQADVRRYLGEDLREARNRYASDPEDLWLQRLFGDYRYLLSAHVLATAMPQVRQPAWLYYLDFLSAGQEDRPGSYHGTDSSLLLRGHLSEDPQARALTETLRRYWTDFARHGDPNGEGPARWPANTAKEKNWMLFSGEESGPRQQVIGARLELLENRYRDRVKPALD